MTFRVGQKVVCVDDTMRVSARDNRGWFSRWRRFEKIGHNLNKGDVYQITGVQLLKDALSGAEIEAVFVHGAWHFGGFSYVPFPSDQFRLAAERKTDISIFTAMLNPLKRSVDA